MADPTYLRYLKTCDEAKALQWADSDVLIEPLPASPSSVAALECAATIVARLRSRTRHGEPLDSYELTAALAQTKAALNVCLRLCNRPENQENG
jgi:hypothetical protein